MKLENTITFTIYLQQCDCIKKSITEVVLSLTPNIYKQRALIGQSMGDCFWLWIEFDIEKEKKEHIQYLINQLLYKDYVVTWPTQKDLDYWVGDDTHKNISFSYLTGHKTTSN